MVYCTKCGTLNPDTAINCSNCGTPSTLLMQKVDIMIGVSNVIGITRNVTVTIEVAAVLGF